MMHCISCGAELPTNVAYCPQCGAVTSYNISASGASPGDPTVASSPLAEPEQTLVVAPQPSPYDLDNPYAIPTPPPPPSLPSPHPRAVKPGLLISVVLAVLILVGGIVTGIFIASKNNAHNNPSTTSFTPTLVGGNTTTPALTTVPSSTTTTSGATPIATLDASTSNPYPPRRGTLALNNSFAQAIGTWDNSSNCQFTNKEYIVKTARGFTRCMDNDRSSSFINFVYQVRMQFLTQNTCGGIIFRNQVNSLVADYYEFYICTNGNYYCGVVGGLYNSLANGSALFNTDVGQPNILAVVAQNTQFQLYINGVQVNQVSENHFSSGTIGVFAYYLTDLNATDEAAFKDLKVWTL